MTEDPNAKLENLLDSVEDLVEAGREMLRKKTAARSQEKFVSELAGEARQLLAELEPPKDYVIETAKPPLRKPLKTPAVKRLPGRLLTVEEASRIIEIRVSKGLSKTAAAIKIGLSGPGYTNIENRSTAGSPAVLQSIRKFFGLPDAP